MGIRSLTLFIVLVLNACTSNTKIVPSQVTKIPDPPVRIDAFENTNDKVESLIDVFSLTDDQKNHFFNYYNSEHNQSRTELDRLYKYLENHLENFNYHSDTLIAKEVLGDNTGNCLSLAILTKSLADLVNINVKFELVETPTIFQKEEKLLLVYNHIRTVLYSGKTINELKGFFNQSLMRVDYFATKGTRALRKVDEAEFFAMYYNNKAAEAMVDNNHNLAYGYLIESLNLYPANATAVSMLGVLHVRLGLDIDAEKIFQYGLAYNNEEEILLKNYHTLLVRSNRLTDADAIAIKLEKYDDNNPFSWIGLADKSFQEKNYSQAIVYYRKAAEMADYLHEPFAGIARSKYHLGKNKSASDTMLKAIANSHKEETIRRYQSKHEYFQSLSNTE